jgi:mycothiol system anti-sigma-R factor
MSCEDDPRCSDTLEHLDELIDAAMTPERYQQLQVHLEECPPCLEQFVLYQDLRWRVADACTTGGQHAPEHLRERIISQITHVRVTSFRAGFSVSVTYGSDFQI